MNDFTFDVGLAYKLKGAALRNGIYDAHDIDWLCQGDNFAKVRQVRLGHAVITVPEHLIDLDADPFVPNGLTVVEHQKGGQFKWDASKVKLHLSKKQQGGKVLEGNKLREELKGQPVYNANLLDHLLKNPHLIPEEWKGKYVFFWGTIYRDSGGDLCVRCLYWDGGRWDWSNDWLGDDWNVSDPAAVPASPLPSDTLDFDPVSFELRLKKLEDWARSIALPDL